MADIRINQLPAEASPVATDVVPIDGASTRKTTIQDLVLIGRPTASQAEAEAGTNPTKVMTPLTTKQSIASEVGVSLASAAQGLLADGAAQKAQNLSDLTDKGAAQDNIQLGAIFADVATAQSATIPPRNKRLRTQFYATANRIGGANYRRISLADLGSYPALSYFRSTDRFMPDGSTDNTNGGYWVLDEKNPTPQMLGALGDGVTNDTAALNAWADFINSGSLLNGNGMTALPPAGRYLIRDTVTFKFGADVQGPRGSARYGFQIVVDAANWSGASVAVMIQAATESFTSAFVDGLSIDCNGASGVEGLRFEGAYQNASLKNIWIWDVAQNAVGLRVKPLDRVGAVTVCESLLLENIYVIPVSGVGTITQPAILLDRCQETKLVNVKGFGKDPGGSGTPGAAGIKLLDCRGIVLDDCSAAFSKYGFEIEANARQSTGVTILGPIYEGITDTSLYIHGTASNKVTNVTQVGTRLESPFATNGFDIEYTDYAVIDAAFQNGLLGANTTSVTIDGFGTVTATAGAKFVQRSSPNAVTDKYVLRSVIAAIKENSPSFDLMVDGRSGQYRWQWSASASVDNWTRFQNPSGNTIMTMGETAGTGVARLAFYGTAAIQKPTVTGAKGGNAALTSLMTQLAALGLVTDSTT